MAHGGCNSIDFTALSPLSIEAHNLKVGGSNPPPATKITPSSQRLGGVVVFG
jgi:hypothetical protein